jgi:isoleucyl-tRNA synthetase
VSSPQKKLKFSKKFFVYEKINLMIGQRFMDSFGEKPKKLFIKYLDFIQDKDEKLNHNTFWKQPENKFEKKEKIFSTLEPSISSETQQIDANIIHFTNDMFKRFFHQTNHSIDSTKLPHTEIQLENKIKKLLSTNPSKINKIKENASIEEIKFFNFDCEEYLIESGKGSPIISNRDHMESVWWGFKTLFEKNLIKMNKKVSKYCISCQETSFVNAYYSNYTSSQTPTCNLNLILIFLRCGEI